MAVYSSYGYDPSDPNSTPWLTGGGTSLAAPCWAGLIVIANQIRADDGLDSLDGASQTLPGLYSLPASDFHDITSGSNGDASSAAVGYDLVTGLGSPRAELLVPALAACTPTVTIEKAVNQDPTNASTINFTVVFSEAVADFETGDVTLGGTAGATTAIVTPVGSDVATYNVAVTGMTGDGTVIVGIAGGKAHNANGIANDASADASVAFDVTPPTVTVNQAADHPDPTKAATINFTVVFSEAVTGFETGDVTLDGSTAFVEGQTIPSPIVTAVGSDGTTYNVAVTGMSQSGDVIVTLLAGVAQDDAGNLSLASTSTDNTVTYDITAPTVKIDRAETQADRTGAPEIEFTVVFSEKVTDFTSGDVALGGTAGATTAIVTPVGSDGMTYDVLVSGMAQSGTVIATVPAGVARDQAGNLNVVSTSTDNDNIVAYDNTSPTVTIDQAAGQTDPAGGPIVNFTVVFSKPVSDFSGGDVTISGTAGGKSATVTPDPNVTDGTKYNVAISGMTKEGTVIATVAAGVAHDDVGNPNVASTSTDNEVTVYPIRADRDDQRDELQTPDDHRADQLHGRVRRGGQRLHVGRRHRHLHGRGNSGGGSDRLRHNLRRVRQRHDGRYDGDRQHRRRRSSRQIRQCQYGIDQRHRQRYRSSRERGRVSCRARRR